MPMGTEEARGFLMRALRQPNWSQITDLHIAVGNLKAKAYELDKRQGRAFISDGRGYLERGEPSIIDELIWSLIVQGVLVPGSDDSNRELPFLRLTEYGKRCTENGELLPHDPDGYLRDFADAAPNADPIVVEYLAEALQCFLRGLNRACAVMLGAASEMAVLVLIDALVMSIRDNSRQAKLRAEVESASSIFRKYRIFEREFSPMRVALPRDLTANLETQLRGVFDLIRNSRNEAGHPASGVDVSRDTNYIHLRLFVPYCRLLCTLTAWFQSNPT